MNYIYGLSAGLILSSMFYSGVCLGIIYPNHCDKSTTTKLKT